MLINESIDNLVCDAACMREMRQLSPGKISMLYVSSEIFCTSGTGVGSGVASMTCGRGVGVTFGVGFGVVLGSSAVF